MAKDSESSVERSSAPQSTSQPVPGTLPEAAQLLSKPARGFLMRLLDKDDKCRLRNCRQLQQTAFYMGYDFEEVKKRKVSPRSIMERHFPKNAEDVDLTILEKRILEFEFN